MPCTFKIQNVGHLEKILRQLKENGIYVDEKELYEEYAYENCNENLGVFVRSYSEGPGTSEIIMAINCINPVYQESFDHPVILKKRKL